MKKYDFTTPEGEKTIKKAIIKGIGKFKTKSPRDALHRLLDLFAREAEAADDTLSLAKTTLEKTIKENYTDAFELLTEILAIQCIESKSEIPYTIIDDILTIIIDEGKIEYLRILLKHGLDVNTTIEKMGCTPLGYAIEKKQHEIAYFLIRNGGLLYSILNNIGYLNLTPKLCENITNMESLLPFGQNLEKYSKENIKKCIEKGLNPKKIKGPTTAALLKTAFFAEDNLDQLFPIMLDNPFLAEIITNILTSKNPI